MTEEKAVYGKKALTTVPKEGKDLTAQDVRRQVNRVQEIMKSVMKKDEHYGIIPGCKKPFLYKAGVEKLMLTFRLAAEYEELSGSIEQESFIVYKIRCTLRHIPTGDTIGSGLGACNSREKKYKTRSVYLNKATDEEKAIGKEEERKGPNGVYKVLIVPQDPWDIQNTLYKMACKRAASAALLNATAVSDIFAQDIEDINDIDALPGKTTRKPDVKMPEKKKQSGGDNELKTVTSKQIGALQAIGKKLKWNNERIHDEASVESLKDLTSFEASQLIKLWSDQLNG